MWLSIGIMTTHVGIMTVKNLLVICISFVGKMQHSLIYNIWSRYITHGQPLLSIKLSVQISINIPALTGLLFSN